jgi:hypothetical protein
MRRDAILDGPADSSLRRGKPGDSPDCVRGQTVRLYLALVCIRRDCKCHHPRLLLEKQRKPAVALRGAVVRVSVKPHRQDRVGSQKGEQQICRYPRRSQQSADFPSHLNLGVR